MKQNKCHVKMFAYAHSPVHSYPLNLNAIDVTAIKKRLMWINSIMWTAWCCMALNVTVAKDCGMALSPFLL